MWIGIPEDPAGEIWGSGDHHFLGQQIKIKNNSLMTEQNYPDIKLEVNIFKVDTTFDQKKIQSEKETKWNLLQNRVQVRYKINVHVSRWSKWWKRKPDLVVAIRLDVGETGDRTRHGIVNVPAMDAADGVMEQLPFRAVGIQWYLAIAEVATDAFQQQRAALLGFLIANLQRNLFHHATGVCGQFQLKVILQGQNSRRCQGAGAARNGELTFGSSWSTVANLWRKQRTVLTWKIIIKVSINFNWKEVGINFDWKKGWFWTKSGI